jgi:SAM-dependent methyltransferase
MSDGAEYQSRVDHQLKQFHDLKKLPTLPPVYFYWGRTYIVPRLKAVTGYDSIFDLYVDQLGTAIQEGRSGLIVSLGAGDCNIEESVAKSLIKKGIENFYILCLEISQTRLDRAAQRIKDTPAQGKLDFAVADLNDWRPPGEMDGVIAHHTLHHIVELERLFERIANAMTRTARFVTADMIGRNGHMRWPEALAIIDRLWPLLPDSYKYQHQFKKQHEKFLNWDCSKGGFEGIRAQDILRLLIEYFDFQHFFAYGNLPDIFVERGYGHNLALDDPQAIALIDLLEHLNENLIDCGVLKPTVMMATIRKKGTVAEPVCHYKHWTPDFCIRRVDQASS